MMGDLVRLRPPTMIAVNICPSPRCCLCKRIITGTAYIPLTGTDGDDELCEACYERGGKGRVH